MLLLSTPELDIIKGRVTNGYNPNNIFASGTIVWDQVVASAALLMNDTIDEYWNGDLINGTGNVDEPGYIGHSTLACAFYYLVKGDAAYGNKVKTKLLAQAANSNPIWENYTPINRQSTLYAFIYSGYLIRLVQSFDYTRDLWSAGEIATFEAYIDRAQATYLKWIEDLPLACFPQRRNRIYPYPTYNATTWSSVTTYSIGDERLSGGFAWRSLQNNNLNHTPAENSWWTKVAGNYAASGQTYGGYDDNHLSSWTHKTPAGVSTNRVYRVYSHANNQDSLMALFVGLWAIYKNDTDKIDRVKIFFEESIIYGLFADGCHAEYIRNGVSFPQLGTMWYSTITLESYIIFADALARIGDNSLWTYSTTSGLWGNTNGGAKNIQLALNTLITNLDGSVVRYFNGGVQDSYKLDGLDATQYRYRCEMMYAIANRNLNDNNYKDTYLLNNSVYNWKNYSSGTPMWTSTAHFRGGCGIYPAMPFWDEMEGVYQWQQRSTSKKMLLSC